MPRRSERLLFEEENECSFCAAVTTRRVVRIGRRRFLFSAHGDAGRVVSTCTQCGLTRLVSRRSRPSRGSGAQA